jgi:hypothetical protein
MMYLKTLSKRAQSNQEDTFWILKIGQKMNFLLILIDISHVELE